MAFIEEKTADTISQKSEQIIINGKSYQIKPATIGTLIQVSRLVPRLPKFNFKSKDIFSESVHIAKDCEAIGEIAATLVLEGKEENPDSFFYRIKELFKLNHKDKIKRLSKYILEEMTISQVNALVFLCFNKMEIGLFFGLTTSLAEINILKMTKEVV